MWYTETDNTEVVEESPMKEKTFQTRCGTIHYWASVSNPDIRRAVALENLISDGRQPDIAEIQTRIRVTVDDNAFSVTAGGLSSRTVHRLFLPRHPPCSGGVQGDLFQYRVKSVAHGIAVGDAFQHSEVIFPVAECRSFTPELADKLAALYGIPVEDILDDYTLFLHRGGGDFLRRYREAKVSRTSIRCWENGQKTISRKCFDLLVENLGSDFPSMLRM